jgi:hypothetical protein
LFTEFNGLIGKMKITKRPATDKDKEFLYSRHRNRINTIRNIVGKKCRGTNSVAVIEREPGSILIRKVWF